MWLFATWLGRIVLTIGVVVVLAGGAAAVAYASDEAIDADVVSKTCGFAGPNVVKVRTRVMGFDYEARLDYLTCSGVPQAAFVQYHVRSGRTVVYESEHGQCLWDSSHRLC